MLAALTVDSRTVAERRRRALTAINGGGVGGVTGVRALKRRERLPTTGIRGGGRPEVALLYDTPSLSRGYLRRVYAASARRAVRGMARALAVFLVVAGLVCVAVAGLGMLA